jgi:hypothetical protein
MFALFAATRRLGVRINGTMNSTTGKLLFAEKTNNNETPIGTTPMINQTSSSHWRFCTKPFLHHPF